MGEFLPNPHLLLHGLYNRTVFIQDYEVDVYEI